MRKPFSPPSAVKKYKKKDEVKYFMNKYSQSDYDDKWKRNYWADKYKYFRLHIM